MGKLGKKARKFAKKNLQSALKRKRKLKAVFKKRTATKRGGQAEAEEYEQGERLEQFNGRNISFDDGIASLDAIFSDDDSDVNDDDSGSDGYLSEDESNLKLDELDRESSLEVISMENKEIHLELETELKKLHRLQEKDHEFCKFLESNDKRMKEINDDEEEFWEEDGTSDDDLEPTDDSVTKLAMGKQLSDSATDYLYQLVSEQQNLPALVKLLNGYRAACNYRTESSDVLQDSRTCSKILMLMLCEGDSIFQKMMGLSSSGLKKEAVLEVINSPKLKSLKPLIKSCLRSTLFLLKEVDDSEMLAFIVSRLRAYILFFAAFPPLRLRLIKVSVHLWATGKGSLSLQSFLVMQDVAAVFNSDCDVCFAKAFKAFIGLCNLIEPELFKHIQFMKDSIVELCSQDVQKSISKASVSLKHLSKILQLGLLTKKKEAVKKICSWQYANCIDLWVAFVSANIRDYDLQSLSYMIIQIINGVALLFPGPRYLPLRVKCVQWLNKLSSSSGVFIPVASLALDALEYKLDKETKKHGKDFHFSSAVKLPKHWLKSHNFQEQCVLSTFELLAVHFSQWSYHISFPELATFPLIRLRKFLETTTSESFRRMVKRFIDQVEQNVDFVQKKRDEVAFSPKDQQSVESFLQLEKSNVNTPFVQHYKSIIERASTRNLLMNEKIRRNLKKEAASEHCHRVQTNWL